MQGSSKKKAEDAITFIRSFFPVVNNIQGNRLAITTGKSIKVASLDSFSIRSCRQFASLPQTLVRFLLSSVQISILSVQNMFPSIPINMSFHSTFIFRLTLLLLSLSIHSIFGLHFGNLRLNSHFFADPFIVFLLSFILFLHLFYSIPYPFTISTSLFTVFWSLFSVFSPFS